MYDSNTNPTTLQLETEAETNKVVELVNNVVDTEIVAAAASTERNADADAESDYVYEYVYYYYDEDGVNGTVVDAQPAGSSVKQVLKENVTAVDIHTNTGNPSRHILATATTQGIRPPSTPALQTTQTWRKWILGRIPRAFPSLASPSLQSPSA